MRTLENVTPLRSAFLKIGWAPIITFVGAIVVAVIGVVLSMSKLDHISDVNDFLSGMKLTMILISLISITGYVLSYLGFAQAHRQLGLSKAGQAFCALKIIFLIFVIMQVLTFIFMILVPSSADSYARMAHNLESNAKAAAGLGIILIIIYLVSVVYSIVALFIIKSQTAKIARTTNIASLNSAATGARWGVYCFFLTIAIGIIDALTAPSVLNPILSLVLFGVCIFALVKWIAGWLGAASEVRLHPVEIEDDDDAPAEA